MSNYDEERPDLVSAVQAGDLEEVQRLTTDLGPFTLSTWLHGFHVLCEAVTRRRLNIAKTLINHGCVVKQGCLSGTVLHVAVIHGDLEIIKMLTNKYCSMTDQNNKGLTALHLLTQRHPVDQTCIRILDHLLANRGNVNIKHTPTDYTPIHFAAEFGNAEMISLLLSKKAQVNAKTKEDRTPLHIAAANRHPEAVRVLLQCDKNLHLKDKNGKTPLCLALENQDLPTIQAFMNYYLRSHSTRDALVRNNPLLIYRAVETMNPSVIKQFLNLGVDLDACSPKTGKNPLHLAVEKGSENIVDMLLKNFANVNAEQKNPGSTGSTALHIAAKKEHPDIFKLLLKMGAKPDAINEKGQSALHLATENGSLPLVTLLLNSGCEISALFTLGKPKGYTPLHIAVENGYEDILQVFLDKRISVESNTKTGLRPLHLAASTGNATLVKILLKYGANPSSTGSTAIETPLFFAAQVGSSEIVEILSEVSTNRKEEWLEGYASLYIASYYGHESVFQILLQKGVDPNSSFKNYLTPLNAAAQKGHKDIVNLLLERGAVVNPSEANQRFLTPIIGAVLNGHEEIVQILLDHGADLSTQLNSVGEVQSKFESLLTYGYSSSSKLLSKGLIPGYKLIHFAAESGNKSIIEMLLKRGIDLNSETEDNETPLSIAVKKEHVEVVAYLLENGANPNLKDSKECLLFTAILNKNAAILELLLNFNTPLNFTTRFENVNGYTPLHLAVMKSNLAVVELLLKRGANVDINTEQDFPLHCAIRRGKKNIISKLIEFGANLESQCDKGLTPLFHSVLKSNKDVFILLLKKGACFKTSTSKGQPLLHFALINKIDEEMIRLIIHFGADVNQKNQNNISPIEVVIKNKYIDPDEAYDPIKEEIELKEKKGMDHDELLRLLLKYGFNVNTHLKINSKTILHYACHTRNTDTVNQLLQYDADVNVLDDKKRTPLFYAVNGASKAMDEFYNSRDYDYEKKKCLKNRDLDKSTFDNYAIRGCYYNERDQKVVENREEYQILARSMTRMITKIQASKGKLHSENHSLVNKDFVKRYYRRCQREIKKLKQKRITKNVTYFDLLVASERKLVNYACNEKIIEAMESEDLKKEFPEFADDLERRFERGLDGKKVLEMSFEFLNKAFKFDVPDPIVDEIFQYLSLPDLLNLCRAGNPVICSYSDRY